MKIKPEHVKAIESAILPMAEKIKAHRLYLQSPQCQKPPKDLELRLRWDCYHSLVPWSVTSEIYKYANDPHIDTVLRSVMAKLQN